jgi:hypothetical protein
MIFIAAHPELPEALWQVISRSFSRLITSRMGTAGFAIDPRIINAAGMPE